MASLAAGKTVTFTITRVPARTAQQKTIRRLMCMQRDHQKGYKALQLRRKREENIGHQRGGREWMVRVKATRIGRIEPGESFTLRLTPQILPDLKSVEKFLTAKAG
jgi:hypothetical protein